MNLKVSSSAELFILAASAIVDRMPHGSQGKLAKVMGVRDGYLSDLIKGKRNWSDRLRDKFADSVGMSVAELYSIGEGINKTGMFFPYMRKVQDTPPYSIHRASRIIQLVMKEIRLEGTALYDEKLLSAWMPKEIERYLKKAISDGDLYDFFLSHFKKALVNYTLKK
jgi:hypothetical protein